jgi:hypothetical protein
VITDCVIADPTLDGVGLNELVVSSPLNVEIDKLIETAEAFARVSVEAMYANDPTMLPVSIQLTPTNPVWILMQSLVKDVQHRLHLVNDAMQGLVDTQMYTSLSLCAILFAITLSCCVMTIFIVHQWGLKNFRHRCTVLSNLFFVVPPHLLKESPAIQRMVESGGLSLLSAAEDEH